MSARLPSPVGPPQPNQPVIRLVVDSNSQLTPELRQRFSIDVVPLTVTVDGREYVEGVDIDAADITAALQRGAAFGTSTPSPGRFLAAYERAAREGVTHVLSVHSGGRATSTSNSARLAAQMASIHVEVLDTGTASFPVTMCAWAAGDVLLAGGSLHTAADAARDTARLVDNVFVVGTLDLAVRGGRLTEGLDQTGIPVLALSEGRMKAVARVTDTLQIVAALADYVVARAQNAALRIGVGDIGASDLADALESALRGRVAVEELVRYVVGPSVAVHTGLGTVGCVFHPVDIQAVTSPCRPGAG